MDKGSLGILPSLDKYLHFYLQLGVEILRFEDFLDHNWLLRMLEPETTSQC